MAEAPLQPVRAAPQAGGDAAPGAALSAPATAVLAALAVAVVAQGAYYRSAQLVVAVLLAASAIGTCSNARLREALGQPVVGAGVLFAGWAVVRGLLAGDPAAARSTVALLAGAIVVVVTTAACDREQRGQLLVGVVVLGVVVALSGWAGVAWRRSPWALEDQNLWRAATTVTYANAAAGLLAAVALLSVARAAAGPVPARWATAATCVLLTGLGATLSRGGFVGVVVGGLVLVRILGLRTVARTGLAPLAGAGVALAGLAPSMPASSEPRPLLAAAALVLGLVVALGAARFGGRKLLVVVVAAVSVAVVVDGRRWSDAASAIAGPRLTAASPDRVDEARAAVRLASGRPLVGVGQGRADLTWIRPDGSLVMARYAHNEYLQVLTELGIVGLVLLVGLFVAAGRTVGRRRAAEPGPGGWAGVVAALVALAVHGLFDFGWHVPAIPLTGALLVGLVTRPKRKEPA